MASIKYSALVTDIKGSIGGTTFKGTRAGAVIQNKVIQPPYPAEGAKITKADAGRSMRNIGNSVQAWKALAPDEQEGWNMAAPNYPFKNKFGEFYTPSGYQLFQSISADLQLIEEPLLTLPPTPEAWTNCPSFKIQVDTSNGDILQDIGTPPTDYAIAIFMTRPLSPGTRGNVRDFRFIGYTKGGSVLPSDITGNYQKVFGEVLPSNGAPFYGKITKTDAGRGGMNFAGTVEYV